MATLQPRSLKRLLLVHETSFLLLVLITGAMGAVWAYFWHQTSTESVRINALLFQAQQVRGDLYRQLQEVARADATTLDDYWNRLYRIDEHFYTLQQRARTSAERQALATMQQSYSLMQTQMNRVLANPSQDQRARVKLLDPAYKQWMLGDFEEAFTRFSKLIGERRRRLEATLEYWTRLAPVLIPIPIVMAMGLLVFSRYSVQRRFVRPMAQVVSGSQHISRGHLDRQIPVEGVEEVATLARSINDMARDLAASRDALVASERQAALGALVPVVAHNIRNPLAGIRATAQLIDADDEPAELEEAKRDIIDIVDRLGRWTSSLLSYLNPLEPRRRASTLAGLVDGALAPLRPRIEEKALRVDKQGWERELGVFVDVDLMEQALYGLLNNAVEASPRQGSLGLSIECAERAAVLLVDDRGPGMPFTPDPKGLSPLPSTKRFGTGLGIPFAFKVIQAHDGRLDFEPRPEGGTRVRLVLSDEQPEARGDDG